MIMNNENGGIQNSGGYAPKMDNSLGAAVAAWWGGLTKDELLDYLRDQPDVTADVLRNMLANENCVLSFGLSFSTATQDAVTNFCNDKKR